MAVQFAMQDEPYDVSLQQWLGKKAENYLFSVMTLDGNKRLYTSPYDYEKFTGQLVNDHTVQCWRDRLTKLAEGKWPQGLPETREWTLLFPVEKRAELLEENAYEIPRPDHDGGEEEEDPGDGSWW